MLDFTQIYVIVCMARLSRPKSCYPEQPAMHLIQDTITGVVL